MKNLAMHKSTFLAHKFITNMIKMCLISQKSDVIQNNVIYMWIITSWKSSEMPPVDQNQFSEYNSK